MAEMGQAHHDPGAAGSQHIGEVHVAHVHRLVRSDTDPGERIHEDVAVGLGRLGLTPNALTVIGFGIAVVAAVAAGLQAWLAAGLLVIFGGVFDLFDGALNTQNPVTAKSTDDLNSSTTPYVTDGAGARAAWLFNTYSDGIHSLLTNTSQNAAFAAAQAAGLQLAIWETLYPTNAFTFQASAAATMAALPVILCGWIAQNKLVRGLSFGAIK